MGLWLLEAAARVVVTMPLLAALGDTGFAVAAVIGVFVGFAPWTRTWWLAAALPITGLGVVVAAGLVGVGGLGIEELVAFAGLKVVQSIAIGTGRSNPVADRLRGLASVAIMAAVAFFDGGLVGLGLLGALHGVAVAVSAGARRSVKPPLSAAASRATLAVAVLVCAVLFSAREAASMAIVVALARWLLDLVARLSRWLHPSRAEQGAAMGGDDPVRYFERTLDATVLLSFGALMLMCFIDFALHDIVGLTTHRLMVLTFSLVVVMGAPAYVAGQWLGRRGHGAVIERVILIEPVVAALGAIVMALSVGAAAIGFGIGLALLVSAMRLGRPVYEELYDGQTVPFAKRELICAAVSAPALGAMMMWLLGRPTGDATELALGAFLVTVVHAASSITYWMLSSRRGW